MLKTSAATALLGLSLRAVALTQNPDGSLQSAARIAAGDAVTLESDEDDGLRVATKPKPLDEKLIAFALERGQARAKLWNGYENVWGKSIFHRVDALGSKHHNIFYVDNPKSGSLSIRLALGELTGESFIATDMPYVNNESAPDTTRKRTSEFAAAAFTSNIFTFSVVRDPVAKFESGVRQAWIEVPNSELFNMTADEILAKQLKQPFGEWLNEHIQPSSWRLSAYSRHNGTHLRPIPFDFIGKIENIDQDWQVVLSKIVDVVDHDKTRFNVLHEAHKTELVDPRSRLSDESILSMCKSIMYGGEWNWFGYERPEVCHGVTKGQLRRGHASI